MNQFDESDFIVGGAILVGLVAIIAIIFGGPANNDKDVKKTAYEQEQKQIYEAKIK